VHGASAEDSVVREQSGGEVRPILVMFQSDWPASDGSSGITSSKVMDDAEAAGRAVEVGSNFFPLFSSSQGATSAFLHDVHTHAVGMQPPSPKSGASWPLLHSMRAIMKSGRGAKESAFPIRAAAHRMVRFVKSHTHSSAHEISSHNLSDVGLKKGLDHLDAVRQKFLAITDRFASSQAQWLKSMSTSRRCTASPSVVRLSRCPRSNCDHSRRPSRDSLQRLLSCYFV
jgi:hypothetical protein